MDERIVHSVPLLMGVEEKMKLMEEQLQAVMNQCGVYKKLADRYKRANEQMVYDLRRRSQLLRQTRTVEESQVLNTKMEVAKQSRMATRTAANVDPPQLNVDKLVADILVKAETDADFGGFFATQSGGSAQASTDLSDLPSTSGTSGSSQLPPIDIAEAVKLRKRSKVVQRVPTENSGPTKRKRLAGKRKRRTVPKKSTSVPTAAAGRDPAEGAPAATHSTVESASSKDYQRVVLDGYEMEKWQHLIENCILRTIWRCPWYTQDCCGLAASNLDGSELVHIHPHNHSPDEMHLGDQ